MNLYGSTVSYARLVIKRLNDENMTVLLSCR